MIFGRDPLVSGARALDGDAGFVEGPRFYPFSAAAKSSCWRPLIGSRQGGPRSIHALDTVELLGPRTRPGGRLLARDAAAPRDRGPRCCASLGCCCSTSRRPGLDPAGMRDMRALVRRLADERDDGRPLEPPDERGRGALQPRRDHLGRPDHPRERARASCSRAPAGATGSRSTEPERARALLRGARASDVARGSGPRSSSALEPRRRWRRSRSRSARPRSGSTSLVAEARVARAALPRAHRAAARGAPAVADGVA